MGALLANMIAMLVGIMVIGFATWGAYDFIDNGITYGSSGTEATIEIYVTVVLLGGFAMVLSTLALMYDCCCSEGFDIFGVSIRGFHSVCFLVGRLGWSQFQIFVSSNNESYFD